MWDSHGCGRKVRAALGNRNASFPGAPSRGTCQTSSSWLSSARRFRIRNDWLREAIRRARTLFHDQRRLDSQEVVASRRAGLRVHCRERAGVTKRFGRSVEDQIAVVTGNGCPARLPCFGTICAASLRAPALQPCIARLWLAPCWSEPAVRNTVSGHFVKFGCVLIGGRPKPAIPVAAWTRSKPAPFTLRRPVP